MITPDPTALIARDAAAAAELRGRFGYLAELVADMERSVPYASALARATEGLDLELRDDEQSAKRLDPVGGVVLTVSNGYALEEAATDRTDPDSVHAMARELVERARAYRPDGSAPPLEIEPDGAADADYATPVEIDPASLPLADKLERYEALRRRLRGMDERSVQAICEYADRSQWGVVVTRGGLVTQQLRRGFVTLILFVSDGTQQRYDFIVQGASGGLEHLEVTDEALTQLAETAVALLSARPVPAGTYDVVTEPVISGTIAHETFGHGMETDMFLKGRARGADYIGRRLGSDVVNIVDDPTLPGGYGTYYVDDEGALASPTQIMRDGILQRGITDLYSASRLGIPRSANGRRESIQRKAYARMSNTFFAPGSSSREEMLSSLDDGLLLGQAVNGMEDPKGWGIQIWAHYATEYKGGKPTGVLYSPIAMTGYLPDLLADISMVSNDFRMDAGTCGKGWKENVPVGSGGPYLRTRCRLA